MLTWGRPAGRMLACCCLRCAFFLRVAGPSFEQSDERNQPGYDPEAAAAAAAAAASSVISPLEVTAEAAGGVRAPGVLAWLRDAALRPLDACADGSPVRGPSVCGPTSTATTEAFVSSVQHSSQLAASFSTLLYMPQSLCATNSELCRCPADAVVCGAVFYVCLQQGIRLSKICRLGWKGRVS